MSETKDFSGQDYNPQNVQLIANWMEGKNGWASGKSLSEYAADAPEGVSEQDLQRAVLEMKSKGESNARYDNRGYYTTALANRILESKFSGWQTENPNATEEEVGQWWSTQGKIELTHPDSGKYSSDRLREMGHGWERGTLILKGNFGESVGGWMKGGKIIVEGNTDQRAGSLMSGGELEINGTTGSELGYGMTGGHIYAKKAAPVPGRLMHDGTIEIDEVDTSLPGSNNVKTDNPSIGYEKTGGKVIVGGKEY